jgi:hypothetical protein
MDPNVNFLFMFSPLFKFQRAGEAPGKPVDLNAAALNKKSRTPLFAGRDYGIS